MEEQCLAHAPADATSRGALLASRERYRAVLHAALDCVVAMDHRGAVVEWNPAAERTFGYTAEEALGREMAELIVPPHLRAAHRAGLARYVAGGGARRARAPDRDHRDAPRRRASSRAS